MAPDTSTAQRSYRSVSREAQARRTRRRVLDAATLVFLERGFAGATMRAIADAAGVAVPTVELLFGTKARVLKAAIDVAIVGDDEQVAVLDRGWTEAAVQARSAQEFLVIVAGVVGSAQERSAGLVLALFQAVSTDAELAELAARMTAQRAVTARWIVDHLASKAPLRRSCSRQEAVDAVWILMDPAVFDRLARQRGWTRRRYERWFVTSVGRLLLPDSAFTKATITRRHTK